MPTPSGNFGDLAHVPVRAFPDRPAVIQDGVTLTYAQLHARMNRVGNLLRALDVSRGRRVALVFPNEWPFVELCFGSMRAGAVPVPLNIRLGYETLRYCVEHSDAEVLVASQALLEQAVRLKTDVPAVRTLVVAGEAPRGALSYDQLLEAASPEFDAVSVAPDDICMQPYTSGRPASRRGCCSRTPASSGTPTWCGAS